MEVINVAIAALIVIATVLGVQALVRTNRPHTAFDEPGPEAPASDPLENRRA